MVVFVAAFGLCYGCASVALSTREWYFENEAVVEEFTLIFGTGVAGCNWGDVGVFRRKGGVAVDNGDRHGGGVARVNSYGGSRRHVYHGRSTAGILTTFRTI